MYSFKLNKYKVFKIAFYTQIIPYAHIFPICSIGALTDPKELSMGPAPAAQGVGIPPEKQHNKDQEDEKPGKHEARYYSSVEWWQKTT